MSKITQLVKGTSCNAGCPMCLSLRNTYGRVPKQAKLVQPYSSTKLFETYKKALDLGSSELVITSFGDPTDIRNMHTRLPHDIMYARLAGFDRVTLITNGFGLIQDDSLVFELVDTGLTHLTLSIHGLDQYQYNTIMGTTYKEIEDVLETGELVASEGVIVRHNYVWHSGLDLLDVVDQAVRYGAKQVTLIEAVPVNQYANSLHRTLPEVPDYAQLLVHHDWGMDIYSLNGITLALCYFGQDDPGFHRQQKNLYINILDTGEIILREGAYFDLKDGIIDV